MTWSTETMTTRVYYIRQWCMVGNYRLWGMGTVLSLDSKEGRKKFVSPRGKHQLTDGDAIWVSELSSTTAFLSCWISG